MNRTDEFDECMACLCFGVRRAARAITQHYDRAVRPLGLRATQFTLLVVLAHAGALRHDRVSRKRSDSTARR